MRQVAASVDPRPSVTPLTPILSQRLTARNVANSALFPKFVLYSRAFVHELRKAKGAIKSMILVPLSI
jgi:hypothetical protein